MTRVLPTSDSATIQLGACEPFGIGGRRLCFAHPDDPTKCVKVLRTDQRRTVRGANSSARFVRFRREYDNNADEKQTLETLFRRFGPSLKEHFPRCFGMHPTDRGPGLVLDLIRDDDGQISRSIRELVSTGTPIQSLKPAFDQFSQFLLDHQIQTRTLLDHNLVAKKMSDGNWKMYLIDGFGDPTWLPISRWIAPLGLRRIERRIATAWPRFEQFASQGGVSMEVVQTSNWGQGFLAHRGRAGSATVPEAAAKDVSIQASPTMDAEPDAVTEDRVPFGTHAVPQWAHRLIQTCHRMPQNAFGTKLAFLLRKPLLKRLSGPLDVEAGGLKLRLFPHGNLADKRLLTTPHLLDGVERQQFKHQLPVAAMVVDIGANVGGYSLLLLKERPDLNILAIETDPNLVKRLIDHMRWNGWQDRCTVEQVGVSECDGARHVARQRQQHDESALQRCASSMDQSSESARQSFMDNQPHGDQIRITGLPLVPLLKHHQIKQVDLLKMNAQGQELAVLRTFFASAHSDLWPTFIQIGQMQSEPLTEAAGCCLDHGYAIADQTRMNLILKRSQRSSIAANQKTNVDANSLFVSPRDQAVA